MSHMKRSLVAVSAALSLFAAAPARADVPLTKEDHLALAKQYEEKAGAARTEATMQQALREDLRKRAPLTAKMPKPLWLTKAEQSCDSKALEAQRAAAELDRSAQYHKSRAQEYDGK